MAEGVTVCVNPQCRKRATWFSQPNFPGTKIAAGNFLLSYGIILAGTSAVQSAETHGNDLHIIDNFL